MAFLRCETPGLFLGTLPLDALCDGAAKRLGIKRCVAIGTEEPERQAEDQDPQMIWSRAPFDSTAEVHELQELLRKAADLLQEALTEVAAMKPKTCSPASSTAPGDSSDEEGGGTEGIRLRVRASRGADEKWGIQWHKNIFQKSHKLVINEIAEGSIIDQWNSSQPEELQVRYGDKLARINGIRLEDLPGPQVAAKFRAELQREEMRALFWRPGTAPPPQATPSAGSTTAPVGTVLLASSCSAGGLATAAAVAVAHALLSRGQSKVQNGLLAAAFEAVGKETQVLLETPKAATLLAALSGLAATLEAPQLPASGQASPEQEAVSEQASASGQEAAATEASERIPEWTYFCRKCGVGLFHDFNVLPHQEGEIKERRDWLSARRAEESALLQSGQDAPASEESGCTSVFVEPMRWMQVADQTGRLACGNPACKQKMGSYSWHGLPCSCGQWQSPAFQIHTARVDCMPAARRARGPAINKPSFPTEN
ncbi:unnamed protein product [Polarella glacialis]|uniref:Uncharacterized protein n=1 Tax=Polarella glacialis TaxID=89957 RepID=A0A813HPC5_POLGL|nr:unnamed protein product [Polarella glacialis]